MDRLKQWLFAITVFLWLLVAGGAQISRARNLGGGQKSRIGGLTLPLNSMGGLEMQGINEPGAAPVKIQAEVTSYRGRRAVRVVNFEGQGVNAQPSCDVDEQFIACRMSKAVVDYFELVEIDE